jgi:hypothetical protein
MGDTLEKKKNQKKNHRRRKLEIWKKKELWGNWQSHENIIFLKKMGKEDGHGKKKDNLKKKGDRS